MSEVSLAEWNRFLQGHPNAHLLQTGEWGELKSAFGWEAIRVITAMSVYKFFFANCHWVLRWLYSEVSI